MQIVTIIEDNPITGVRYGTVEMPEYNNNIQRRLERHYRLRNLNIRRVHENRTRQK